MKEPSHAATVDAANQLSAEPPERHGVVAAPCARSGDRRLFGQKRRHPDVVGGLLDGDRCREPWQPCSVRHQVAYEDVVLAVGGEFGPVAADGSVELELTALEQQQDADGYETLRPREDADQRVLVP